MAKLRPLGNSIMFRFLDHTGGAKGAFTETHKSGIIIPTTNSTQRSARWGEVVSVGDKVDGVSVGDFILIEPLMWSFGVSFNGEKIWKTDDTKVLAVTNDRNDCVSQGL
jgi:co-chaperonin GroES (HSP10)